MKKIFGVLTLIIIIIFPVFSGCIFFNDDDKKDSDKVKAFGPSDLSVPEYQNLEAFLDDPVKPQAGDEVDQVPFKYETSWAFAYNKIYAEFGGILQLWLTNLGDTEMFVYEFGLAPEWLNDNFTTSCAKLLQPTEKLEIGFLAFPGPPQSGLYKYQLKFGVMVRMNDTSAWFDWGLTGNKSYELDVLQLPTQSELSDWKLDSNNKGLYNTVNDLIDPMQKDVRNKAVNLAKKYEGTYNVFQVCEIFEFIKNNISYVNDPRGDSNYWSTPEETLSLCAGDCEDQAIIFAGIISAIDGTARICMTDSHAFALLYIGKSTSTRDGVISAINSYYRADLSYAWLHDELGYWLVTDTIYSLHLGGLPLGAEPLTNDADDDLQITGLDDNTTSWSWNFDNTEAVHIIDVI